MTNIAELTHFRDQIRLWTLKELHHLGFGHYGGSLSIVEALAVLYGDVLNVNPNQPDDPERDYFILSKGHGGPALYAALAVKGFFDRDWLYTLNKNGTNLPSHPDRNKTPGVEMTTGSLGQGISVAAGVAFSNKLANKNSYTYTIVGDGELNEGQCWEAIQFAAHNQLSKFVVLVDDNKKQLDGLTVDICNPFDFAEKFRAFGFEATHVDGRDLNAIREAILKGKQQHDKPVAIILDTVKAQGVPFLEEKMDNHHVRPNEDDLAAIEEAIAQLEDKLSQEGVFS
ncbi:transketolase [Sporosarcina beigongshangi]|uniref:transketolase n=1 Tax=Sporosarcina beigongshangi TaxID=2782538 RepID=UPI0019395459|nr:transketolase [Sporosarcina beigongshangi]